MDIGRLIDMRPRVAFDCCRDRSVVHVVFVGERSIRYVLIGIPPPERPDSLFIQFRPSIPTSLCLPVTALTIFDILALRTTIEVL
jgi:hypothetical protein